VVLARPTFLNTLIDTLRSNWGHEGDEGYDETSIGLITASKGIAATLLKLGQTFHSVVNAPCTDLNGESCFLFYAGSELAWVIIDTILFVCDEGSMACKHLMTGPDNLFKDLMQDDIPFVESWWSRVETLDRTCPLSQVDQRHKSQMHV
jgi:hypothetical protein